ncbi:MAG: hypothetical protein WCN88_03350 [Candidatus Falkowbacteria bacterium]
MTKEEVFYWPLWLSKLLSKKEQIKVKKILPKLQRAQIFLWRALNIYDDIYDDEGGRLDLPMANKYFRKYLEIVYRLNLSPNYYSSLEKTFNNLDRANSNELLQKRLKIKNGIINIASKIPPRNKLKNLSNKSLALAFAPLALFDYLSFEKHRVRTRAALNFFRYALAAKQLADDSQNWLEDLKNGLITNANRPIVMAARKKRLKLKLSKSPLILNLLYAQIAAPIIISDLKRLCALAETNLSRIKHKPKNMLINRLIKPIKDSTLKAEKFRAQVLEVSK